MVPHYNYFPPAGAVIDASEPRAVWTGRAWSLNGKPYSVPQSHRLTGKPGGALAGWYYDWAKKAWMEPSPAPPTPKPAARPTPAMRPVARPQQPAPSAPSQPQQPQPPAPKPEKEIIVMEKKPHTILEDIVKHPIAPVLGGLLYLAAYITDEPQPPTIPDGLPQPVAKQWQMIFAQNQQRFERRMSMYRDLGSLLLGYSGARSIADVISALPANRLPAAPRA